MLDFLLHIPHSYLDPDALLTAAFKIKLSEQELTKLTERARLTDVSLGDIPDVMENSTKNLEAGRRGRKSPSEVSFGSAKDGKRSDSIGRNSGGMGSIGRSFMRKTGSSY